MKIICGFIGLGLIGGSIAKALKQNRDDIVIYAYDKNPDTLRLASEEGIADLTFGRIDPAFSRCNIIFLCAPVSHNDDNLLLLKEYLGKECILTDVGSVKTTIHKHISSLGLDSVFIGGHPMAGSERFGYQNSKAELLENAYYILTPTERTSPEQLDLYKGLVLSTKAIPLILSYEEHDYYTAGISHLPHVIASSLVNLVRETDSADGVMKMIAAGGFKDITRIASSSPEMWQPICLTNKENLSALLERYIRMLLDIKKEIDDENRDSIYRFFDSARQYRDSFIGASSGPIKKVFSLNVTIADKPGAIAAVSTMMAQHGISIKNIGIVHNREYEEGVMQIEFYEESGMNAATDLLIQKGYCIHKKN